MIGSAATKTEVESVMVDEIRLQIMRPAARKGRKSDFGALKSEPKITPIQAIIIPVEIVIQNGPKEERR